MLQRLVKNHQWRTIKYISLTPKLNTTGFINECLFISLLLLILHVMRLFFFFFLGPTIIKTGTQENMSGIPIEIIWPFTMHCQTLLLILPSLPFRIHKLHVNMLDWFCGSGFEFSLCWKIQSGEMCCRSAYPPTQPHMLFLMLQAIMSVLCGLCQYWVLIPFTPTLADIYKYPLHMATGNEKRIKERKTTCRGNCLFRDTRSVAVQRKWRQKVTHEKDTREYISSPLGTVEKRQSRVRLYVCTCGSDCVSV